MPRASRARPVRIAAVGGALFGLLSIAAGTRVLAGIETPAYAVVRWLVWYNVAAGAFSVAVAVGLWTARRWASWTTLAVAVAHGGVLIALVVWRAAGGAVADDSLVAMTLRTVVWSAIVAVVRRTPAPRG